MYCLLHSQHIRTLALLLPHSAYSHALTPFCISRETEIPKQLLLEYLIRHRDHPVDVGKHPRIMEKVGQEIQQIRHGSPSRGRSWTTKCCQSSPPPWRRLNRSLTSIKTSSYSKRSSTTPSQYVPQQVFSNRLEQMCVSS